MRTYVLFKSSLVKGDYLNLKNGCLRKSIKKFREIVLIDWQLNREYIADHYFAQSKKSVPHAPNGPIEGGHTFYTQMA